MLSAYTMTITPLNTNNTTKSMSGEQWDNLKIILVEMGH